MKSLFKKNGVLLNFLFIKESWKKFITSTKVALFSALTNITKNYTEESNGAENSALHHRNK